MEALSIVLLALSVAGAAEPSGTRVSWFTDVAIEGAVKSPVPSDPPPECPGTSGRGVKLVRPVPSDWPEIRRDRGSIGFWIRPDWSGDDGKRHVILTIGEPGRNGLLVEKAPSGMLRHAMSTPEKTTAARADVSGWKAGEWHHVAVAWTSARGRPLGLPLWIDRACVAGPIFGAGEFPRLSGESVRIGDATSDAAMDELVLRTDPELSGQGEIGNVYRDWFLTAPYESVAIDLHPMYGPMDPRAVEGCPKQFGLLASRAGRMEKVTDFAVRYAQWSYHDARPFIRWGVSDGNVATVDTMGVVTGRKAGRCTLEAEFRGMKASREIEVIPIDRPDLDLVYVERLPRYPRDAEKDRPAPGDPVRSAARIINFGYRSAPAGARVRFELIPDRNRNFRRDPGEAPAASQEKTIDRELAPREEIEVAFEWTWTDEPTWVRVAVDPAGKFDEICDANNERCELNTARPLQMAVDRPQLECFWRERKINHAGSFSEFDWVNGQVARFEEMMRDAVFPTTSPDGVRESFRVDRTYVLDTGKVKWEDEPYTKDEALYDGGFPIREPIDLMAIDGAILHEFGHTCAALPDLYGYGVQAENVLLRDARGAPWAGGDLMPRISDGSSTMPFSSANNVPCGAGGSTLMDFCSLRLAPFEAGAVQWFAGYRGNRFWGTQGRMMPAFEQFLKVYDVEDRPLAGAAVYVYGVAATLCGEAGTKYFADRPKFIGSTDAAGRFRFPGETDADWDDPDTDEVDGSIKVWNPFGRAANQSGTTPDVAFTPNVVIVEGFLLVKVVSGDSTEFYWLPLTEFNTLFLSGGRHAGTVVVRTSLPRASGPTPVVRPEVPAAIRKVDRRPAARADIAEIPVRPGERFTLDGSKSSDPEGQPLTYRWRSRRGGVSPESAAGSVLHARAPDGPMECEYELYVIDGVRCSPPVSVLVHVVAPGK